MTFIKVTVAAGQRIGCGWREGKRVTERETKTPRTLQKSRSDINYE